MRWFEGDVVAAIAETKRLGALFVVYIQGGKEAVSYLIYICLSIIIKHRLALDRMATPGKYLVECELNNDCAFWL